MWKLSELRKNFSRVLSEFKEPIAITNHGEVVGVLVPADATSVSLEWKAIKLSERKKK